MLRTSVPSWNPNGTSASFPTCALHVQRILEINTTVRGYRRATSIDATLTGLGGDLFIIDDPQKPADAQSEPKRAATNRWFSNTLISRLDNKQTSAVIIVMQRVHQLDLVGYLTEGNGNWKVLRLPAIADKHERVRIGSDCFYEREAGEALHAQHESKEVLEDLSMLMSPDDFSAQYQQRPVPPAGGIIQRRSLRYHDETPDRILATKVILSIDPAMKSGPKNDWSVGILFYVIDNCYYVIDMFGADSNSRSCRTLYFHLPRSKDQRSC